jgi:hypothetical protein
LQFLWKRHGRTLPALTISKVFDRLPVVHRLIVDDRGGNSRVEESERLEESGRSRIMRNVRL